MGEGPHNSLTPGGWKGSGKGERPSPRQRLAPRDRHRQAAPPAATGEQHRGTRGGQRGAPPLPPSPLSLPGVHGQPEAGQGDGGPAPPRGARGRPPPPLERAAAPGEGRTPPVSRPPTPTVAAAGQQLFAGARGHPADRIWAAARGRELVQCEGQGNNGAAHLDARPGGAERQTEAERPPDPRAPGPPGRTPDEGQRTNPPPSSPQD